MIPNTGKTTDSDVSIGASFSADRRLTSGMSYSIPIPFWLILIPLRYVRDGTFPQSAALLLRPGGCGQFRSRRRALAHVAAAAEPADRSTGAGAGNAVSSARTKGRGVDRRRPPIPGRCDRDPAACRAGEA